jgi:hypothetical protein
MRDFKFACPHCEQHIKCEDEMAGRTIACPSCGREVVVPMMPDEHHLRITTGHVPVPAHAHGAPRAGDAAGIPSASTMRPHYSKFAIASLSLSCASVLLLLFGCIPGIIFGYLARAELRRNPRLLGAELANAGITTGYCFLSLFTLIGCWLAWRYLRGLI